MIETVNAVLHEYLFMIIFMTNRKCQITQQSCIDNTSKTLTSKLQTPWKMIEIVNAVLHVDE